MTLMKVDEVFVHQTLSVGFSSSFREQLYIGGSFVDPRYILFHDAFLREWGGTTLVCKTLSFRVVFKV